MSEAGNAECRWEELTSPQIQTRIRLNPLVLIPLGSVEWHGPHCAVGLDYQTVMRPVEEAALRLGVLRVPPVVWGGDSPEGCLPGSLIVSGETTRRILIDLIESLKNQGVRAVLGVSGHGAPGQTEALRKANLHYRDDPRIDVLLRITPHLVAEADVNLADLEVMDHAGAVETALQMISAPGRVDMSALPADLRSPLLGFIGRDPRTTASPALGRQIEAVVTRSIVAVGRQMLERAKTDELPDQPPACVSGRIRARKQREADWIRDYLLLYNGAAGMQVREIPAEDVIDYRFGELRPGRYYLLRWRLTDGSETMPFSQAGDFNTFVVKPGENKVIDLVP